MTRADVAVYSPEGNLQLVVEIKNRSGASAEWVIQMRRNLRVHAIIPPSPYFLLVLPDFFYLWTDAVSVPDPAPPAYQIKAEEVLAPYLDQSTRVLIHSNEYSFELLVTSWLEDSGRNRPPTRYSWSTSAMALRLRIVRSNRSWLCHG